MKKLHYLVGLLLCISCTQNQKNTPSEKETYKITLECDYTICPDEFISENIKTETLDEIVLKSNKKQGQQLPSNISKFKFNTNESVTLVANQKTKVSIPPNSFRYIDSKKQVKGNVEIEIKEFYKKSEFVLANLTSQTKDKLLESRGMIYISAKANRKECELIDGKQIKIDFPTKEFETGFQNFAGKKNEDNQIIWALNEANKEDRPNFSKLNPRVINSRNKRINVSFSSNIKRGNDYYANDKNNAYCNWLVKEFIKKFKDKDLSKFHMSRKPSCKTRDQYVFSRRIYFDFLTTKGSGIDKSHVPVGTDYFLDLKKLLKNIPSEVCSKGLSPNQKHKNFITVDVDVDARGGFNVQKFKNEYTFTGNYGYYDSITIYSDDLKWINCDRFLNRKPEELTPLFVDIGENEDHDVKLVFKDINSVMAGKADDSKLIFQNIPLNEEVYIVATKKVSGKNYFSITPIKVSKQPVTVTFQEYTKDSYIKALEKLNNS